MDSFELDIGKTITFVVEGDSLYYKLVNFGDFVGLQSLTSEDGDGLIFEYLRISREEFSNNVLGYYLNPIRGTSFFCKNREDMTTIVLQLTDELKERDLGNTVVKFISK
jgi:hypothetical protein